MTIEKAIRKRAKMILKTEKLYRKNMKLNTKIHKWFDREDDEMCAQRGRLLTKSSLRFLKIRNLISVELYY